MRTQVGIVGAGPAGLMLSHLLHLQGIDSIVVEARSRQYVEDRVRAGVLEQGTVDLMVETGVGERLKREGLIHHGMNFASADALTASTSRSWPTAAALTCIRRIKWWRIFSTRASGRRAGNRGSGRRERARFRETIQGSSRARQPKIRFRAEVKRSEIECDFIAGCDGFHGVCRPSIPAGALTVYDRIYPFAWLGISRRGASLRPRS